MKRTTIGFVLIAMLTIGMTIPGAATSVTSDHSAAASSGAAEIEGQENAIQTDSDSSVDVTVGQQLSTVIGVSSDEVQTDFENTAFEVSVEEASEEEQAEAVAERAEELREEAEDIREEYEDATEEYEEGDISKSEYAQRLATLNARATNIADSYEQLQRRAANVSASELRSSGVDPATLDDPIDNVSSVSGTGAAALLDRFTGEAEGEIELETADGLSIEVTGEDGERSRELERTRDDDRTISVSQSTALQTARKAIATPETGDWQHVESSVKDHEGAYEFEFALRNAPDQTGEAEVRVDGSSGKVYKLEEEIEARDGDDEDEDEREDDDEREDEDEREDDDEREDEDEETETETENEETETETENEETEAETETETEDEETEAETETETEDEETETETD
ncbi:DUF7096 domain-containing protein [Natrinema halophilum]|uniref:DUF7096 domain-containing protein n=1 Tax=Natrinema halophilum TaxID=1699371 RepID=A0A7D5KSM0_9EURY|nr:hypothetical protein [Natrinema halophilum]QLG50477.1 hypothetical protein HYG82_17300 [Natrinema halophilum]